MPSPLDGPFSATGLQFLSFEPVHLVVTLKTPGSGSSRLELGTGRLETVLPGTRKTGNLQGVQNCCHLLKKGLLSLYLKH